MELCHMFTIIFTGLIFNFVHGFGKRNLNRETVIIDLQTGLVEGYSKYIDFIAPPTISWSRNCDSQAVVRIDLSGPFKSAKFHLNYGDRPRMWTLDISDSPTGDGHGGDNGTTSNMAEMQIFNKQMRLYGNSLEGYFDATINGGLLIKVVDDFIKRGTKVVIDVSDEKVEWQQNDTKDFVDSKFLFTLDGQETLYGKTDYNLYAGFNRVVAGTYRSGSGLCKVAITLHEDPAAAMNECKEGRHNCHKDAECHDTRRSFKCKCKDGFYGNGKICVDDNECDYENGGCVHYCSNTHGNYTCACKTGFKLHKDGHNCLDNNECFHNRGGCQHQCLNTLGSYECKCNSGYSLQSDGKTCVASTWCRDSKGCAHHCIHHGGRSYCACRHGYQLASNKRDCKLTCNVGNGGCQHKCTDGPRGPICGCAPNYMLTPDRKKCLATCKVDNGGCDRKCEDTPTGPRCICPPGFLLHQDRKTCIDVDECDVGNGGCSHTCLNNIGSFECVCPVGFKTQADERTCKDVDECTRNGTCDHTCINTPGSFQCKCHAGYAKYAITHCGDINECSINNGGCQQICRNKKGSHECLCEKGYKLHINNKDCVSEKCQPLMAPAKAILSCSHTSTDELCTLTCEGGAEFTREPVDKYTFKCGSSTLYKWTNNATLPTCSDSVLPPSFKRKAKFLFMAEKCRLRRRVREKFQENLQKSLSRHRKFQCSNLCQVNFVNLQCGSRRRKFRQLTNDSKALITAEFEIEMSPQSPTSKCDVKCMKEEVERRLKKAIRILRKSINKDKFYVKFEGNDYEVTKRSFKAGGTKASCSKGKVLVREKCVACAVGSYYDSRPKNAVCRPCSSGYYQDKEGQMSCKQCPESAGPGGYPAASSLDQCGGRCEPGSFSNNAYKPCTLCPKGTYQPEAGRTQCIPCGFGIQTASEGSLKFQDCDVKETCKPGYFYSNQHSNQRPQCLKCPKSTYQSEYGQNYCVQCPGKTTTDSDGARNSSECKDRKCGGHIGLYQGYIETPNYPGDYPSNIECTWSITPEKGRRILIIIPEIHLAEGKCGDSLVMRKSQSNYSISTLDTCVSTDSPIAFTARSRKLWIRFKTDSHSSESGFSIPYVTYNEEYQELIEDIVSDGRLYSLHQHRSILQDRTLLAALMEVIAQPHKYFAYANTSMSMFPESFIKLLRPKVLRFFNS
ncbi:unnamed protein product [Owenia fusiformis]|uniref:Uncharacterized protein n=1 Tax=Owenia fusiformis TaxID=6347 RepID=A0A8J1XVB4_OWEFU|nr:unnamed protein product [Owenia fusiformis]